MILRKTGNPKVIQRHEKFQNEEAFWGNFILSSSNVPMWIALPTLLSQNLYNLACASTFM